MKENQKNVKVIEAAKILKLSLPTVRKIAKSMGWKEYKEGVTRYSIDDVLKYKAINENKVHLSSLFGELSFDFDESIKLLDSINNPRNTKNPRDYLTSSPYAATNKGRVCNLKHGWFLAESYDTNGYAQVGIQQGKTNKMVNVHRLIAYLWCQNGKFKPEVHHIDGNRKNNNASNLIWLTKAEHIIAHKLMKKAKESGNFEEYYSYIQKMQSENAITENIKLLTLVDASGFNHYVYVSESLFNEVKRGERSIESIKYNEVILESIDEVQVAAYRRAYSDYYNSENEDENNN